ncbi:hypothetical protein PN36_01470 [Candidatus Thiomargarita nelsonii]|uniref:BrnA antitoxin of type II toxin-antitoxin system n=1 Tax=Candidatus Thiomargarita nelsonii TaxID=1003181 RepID=A0A0A6P3E7_9GAMM|nr:hypothetical protein PN36_01470 [Candidatus Thiomargarita nelsonii]
MRIAQERGEDQSDWERVRTAGDFEWDGQDDEDRPLSKKEMRIAISQQAHQKVSTIIQLDTEVLEYFHATGKRWQTRINEVLREYVISHGSVIQS